MILAAGCGGGEFHPPEVTEAGSDPDAATTSPICAANDAGAVKASCTEAELAAGVRTAASDLRVIVAPDRDPSSPFVPNCMVIKVGQTVTWTGAFSKHPLIPRENSTLPNPIQVVASGTSTAVTFDCAGTFNFSCRTHKDNMLGTVRVVP